MPWARSPSRKRAQRLIRQAVAQPVALSPRISSDRRAAAANCGTVRTGAAVVRTAAAAGRGNGCGSGVRLKSANDSGRVCRWASVGRGGSNSGRTTPDSFAGPAMGVPANDVPDLTTLMIVPLVRGGQVNLK